MLLKNFPCEQGLDYIQSIVNLKIMSLKILILLFSAGAFAGSSTYDKDAVRNIIAENINLFRKCYINEIRNFSKLYGKIVLNWKCSDQGKILSAKIGSTTIDNKNVEDCLVATVKTLKFPPAPKGQTVDLSYPFVFENK